MKATSANLISIFSDCSKNRFIATHYLFIVSTTYNTSSNKKRQRFYLININPP